MDAADIEAGGITLEATPKSESTEELKNTPSVTIQDAHSEVSRQDSHTEIREGN
jgi:hypothetical protein